MRLLLYFYPVLALCSSLFVLSWLLLLLWPLLLRLLMFPFPAQTLGSASTFAPFSVSFPCFALSLSGTCSCICSYLLALCSYLFPVQMHVSAPYFFLSFLSLVRFFWVYSCYICSFFCSSSLLSTPGQSPATASTLVSFLCPSSLLLLLCLLMFHVPVNYFCSCSLPASAHYYFTCSWSLLLSLQLLQKLLFLSWYIFFTSAQFTAVPVLTQCSSAQYSYYLPLPSALAPASVLFSVPFL